MREKFNEICIFFPFLYPPPPIWTRAVHRNRTRRERFRLEGSKKERFWRNLRGCARAKTLSVLAAYSSISSWCEIPGSRGWGWSACIPYISINLEIGGILGRALPVMFGACFKPNLFKICSLMALRLRALISSCILQALQVLPALARYLTRTLSMPGTSKAPKRTSKTSNTIPLTILLKVALSRISYNRFPSQTERSNIPLHRCTLTIFLLIFPHASKGLLALYSCLLPFLSRAN